MLISQRGRCRRRGGGHRQGIRRWCHGDRRGDDDWGNDDNLSRWRQYVLQFPGLGGHHFRAERLQGRPGVREIAVRVQLRKHVGRDLPHRGRFDRDCCYPQETNEPQHKKQEKHEQVASFPIRIILTPKFLLRPVAGHALPGHPRLDR